MIIKGELAPYDNIPGCTFTIDMTGCEESGMVHVKLFSPADNKILAESITKIENVGEWLYNKKDW